LRISGQEGKANSLPRKKSLTNNTICIYLQVDTDVTAYIRYRITFGGY
jgi:hypothetical protein